MVYQKLALLAQNKFGQAQKRPSMLGDDGRGGFSWGDGEGKSAAGCMAEGGRKG